MYNVNYIFLHKQGWKKSESLTCSTETRAYQNRKITLELSELLLVLVKYSLVMVSALVDFSNPNKAAIFYAV